MTPTLFLDLDGVLVDFVRGAMALHDRYIPYDEVAWDFHEQLGLSAEAFWSPMNEDFWARLPWTPEGPELLSCLEDIFEDIVLLTSPCSPACAAGKMRWVEAQMPAYTRRLLLGSCKDACAGDGKILLDDSDRNVELFRRAGGFAVLYPRPWNTLAGESAEHLVDFLSWVMESV